MLLSKLYGYTTIISSFRLKPLSTVQQISNVMILHTQNVTLTTNMFNLKKKKNSNLYEENHKRSRERNIIALY